MTEKVFFFHCFLGEKAKPNQNKTKETAAGLSYAQDSINRHVRTLGRRKKP